MLDLKQFNRYSHIPGRIPKSGTLFSLQLARLIICNGADIGFESFCYKIGDEKRTYFKEIIPDHHTSKSLCKLTRGLSEACIFRSKGKANSSIGIVVRPFVDISTAFEHLDFKMKLFLAKTNGKFTSKSVNCAKVFGSIIWIIFSNKYKYLMSVYLENESSFNSRILLNDTSRI